MGNVKARKRIKYRKPQCMGVSRKRRTASIVIEPKDDEPQELGVRQRTRTA